jgi:hypothetical protein
MKGAMAVPAVRIMMREKISSTIINGNNQNFLRTLRNCQSSFKNSMFDFLIL